jgi:hypothetical protein
MVWTAATQANYTRPGLIYATGLTEEEWSVLEADRALNFRLNKV